MSLQKINEIKQAILNNEPIEDKLHVIVVVSKVFDFVDGV
jgi:hypothetical protein